MAELGQVSKSLVYRDHSCSLAMGQDGMAHGCLSSVSKYKSPFVERQAKWGSHGDWPTFEQEVQWVET